MSYWVQQPPEITPEIVSQIGTGLVETDTPAMKSNRNLIDAKKKERIEIQETISELEKELEKEQEPGAATKRMNQITNNLMPRMIADKKKLRSEINKLESDLEDMEKARLRNEKAKKQAPPPSQKPEAPKETVTPANRRDTNSLQPKKSTYIVVHHHTPEAAGHEHRHYKLQHLETTAEKELWHALFKLSQKIARESKYLVYRTLTKHLGHKNLLPDLCTLGCTAVALAENNGIPLTPEETIHQIVRSFLHLHDAPLQAIIWAYLRRYYGLITDREAFAVLVFALETELKQFFRESEPWDMAFIDNFFKTNENRRLRVLMALNYGLIELELRVVFIEWIGDWKNFMKLHTSQHGPLKWITDKDHPQKIKCPDLEIIRKFFKCPLCDREFPSYTQLKNHLHENIFGNNETPTFRKTKDKIPNFIPIDILKPPFKEVKTGLIYIQTDMPVDANLFFIRSKQHFRNCAIFDDEKKSRVRFDVKEGKLISVGISQTHCTQFVYDNFETFIGLINLYKNYINGYQKARNDQVNKEREKEKCTLDFQEKMNEAALNKINLDPIEMSIQDKKQLKLDKEAKIAYELCQTYIKTWKPIFDNQITEYNRNLKSSMVGYEETFNKKLDEDQMHAYISKAQFLKKMIELYREKLANETNLEKRAKIKKLHKSILNGDFVQFALIVFAIFNSDFIKEQMEKILNDTEFNLKKYSNQKIFYMPKHLHNPTYDLFVRSITDNMKNLSEFGLVFSRNHREISPIFTMFLNDWLSPLEKEIGVNPLGKEIGVNPLGKEIVPIQIDHTKIFQDHAKILTKNIENEWKSMQAHYGGVQDINGASTDITDSTAYKWTPEMSGNELEKKEIEDLKVYLMRQVFIVKADCANWKYLEALTHEIIRCIRVEALTKRNAETATKNAMIKCIKRRSVLCDLIAEVEQDKEWIVNIESSKIDFTPHVPTDRDFEMEEREICPEVRRDSLLIISSSDYTSMSSIFQRQGYLYQSNLLLHPVYYDNSKPYLPRRILQEKWWELRSDQFLSMHACFHTGMPFDNEEQFDDDGQPDDDEGGSSLRPRIPVKIPGRGGPNRVLTESFPRYYDEAGITTHFLMQSSTSTSGDIQPTLFDLVSEQMISRSESVEDLLKSVKEKMKLCHASKKFFSREIAEQFGYYDDFPYDDEDPPPDFESVWQDLRRKSTSDDIIKSIDNFDNFDDDDEEREYFGDYKLILPFLASITRTSIEVYTEEDNKNEDNKNGKLHLSRVYNKTLDPYCVPYEDHTTIIKSVNITKEPIRLLMEKYGDEGKIWISHLFVKKYTTVTKTPDKDLTGVQRYLRGLKDKWNDPGTYSNDGISFEMSHCKYYLYLVHRHIIHIPQAVLKRLKENVSDNDARTLRSMEKLLLVGHMIEQDSSSISPDHYEVMLMESRTELMEQCVQTLKTVKTKLLDKSKTGKIVNEDIGPALAQEQVEEEQTQSGFRSTQGKKQGKDGGYDPGPGGPGGGGGGSGNKTFEVRHTTSEEEDFDDEDDELSDREHDEEEDPRDSEGRKETRKEIKKLLKIIDTAGGRVAQRQKNGDVIWRDQHGNEKQAQLKAEGDLTKALEKKRRDDANRAAANKANKAAQAAQDRQDNADWGGRGRGTQNPYYVDLGIYM